MQLQRTDDRIYIFNLIPCELPFVHLFFMRLLVNKIQATPILDVQVIGTFLAHTGVPFNHMLLQRSVESFRANSLSFLHFTTLYIKLSALKLSLSLDSFFPL